MHTCRPMLAVCYVSMGGICVQEKNLPLTSLASHLGDPELLADKTLYLAENHFKTRIAI